MAGPTKYELECAHCGCLFALEETSPARTATCPVCGGSLTVAVLVPLVPPAPPAPIPPPVEDDLPEPPIPVPAPSGPGLAPPWPDVRKALDRARGATDFGRALYVFYLLTVVVASQIVTTPGRYPVGDVLVTGVGLALFLPAAVHVRSQWVCTRLSPSFGSGFAEGSVLMLLFTPLCLFALFRELSIPVLLFAFGGVFAAAVAFGLWLLFLVRLGERLGGDELVDAARAAIGWHWWGFVVSMALLCGMLVAAQEGAKPAVWFAWGSANMLGYLLLRGYSSLLSTAVDAIDRRAPAAPGP